MERLTAFDGEFWIHKNFPPVEGDRVDEFIDCVKDLASRLAKIENILGDDYDLERLKELVEADRDGKCAVLPCKVGSTVYFIGGIHNTLIKEVDVEDIYIADGSFALGVSTGFKTFAVQEGEWYATREEAEAALEKMKEREK